MNNYSNTNFSVSVYQIQPRPDVGKGA